MKAGEAKPVKKLSIEEIRCICDEIVRCYGIAFSDYQEERKDGEIKFVHLTLKFKVSKQGVDKSRLYE